MKDLEKQKTLSLNRKQAAFYDTPNEERPRNTAMRLWRFFRRRMYFVIRNSSIDASIAEKQKVFLGDLAGKKVLDFGCFDGNKLSVHLAREAAEYWGIDLSELALRRLADLFRAKGIENVNLQCVDILSADFAQHDYDVIFAQGVLHHFESIDLILEVLHSKLKPGGIIVSMDPLRTNWLLKFFRVFYHKIRTDREWEWPFDQLTFVAIKKYFSIRSINGFVGRSKWAIPIAVFSKDASIRLANYLHKYDLENATSENSDLWDCLQVVICMQKPVE